MRPQLSRGFRTSKPKKDRIIANNSVGQLVTLGLPDEGVERLQRQRSLAVRQRLSRGQLDAGQLPADPR
jgi:hypothetical protein